MAAVHGALSLSYRDLNRRANRLAHHLINQGVQPGESVAIALPRSLDLLVCQLAILKCAAVYVPLDINAPAERQAFIVQDSGAHRVLNSLADLIQYAKANPAKLNYASGGNGSAGHLAGEMFKKEAGIFALHIPYNGGNPAQLALLSGQVDFNFDNLATASSNIKDGKLKALAVTTAQRSAMLPEVPAVAETLKGFAIDTWWGLVAPAGTPKDVITKLNQAFVAALNSPEAKTRFAMLMAEPVANTPEQFGAFMKSELAKYEKVVKASGARVD